MKLIIDIPKDDFIKAKEDSKNHLLDRVWDAVAHGTPLPKHHGKLIDADWVKNILDLYTFNFNGIYNQFIRRDDIDDAPTIIEGSETNETDNIDM